METLLAFFVIPVVAFAYLTGRRGHAGTQRAGGRAAHAAIRAARAFRDFNADNVELWERYLRAQRPWEPNRLRWVHTVTGWRLEGSTLPTDLTPPSHQCC